jgi:hypothetical protein
VIAVVFWLLLPLIIYTLIARTISSIGGKKRGFESTFSKSRLPATIVLIATRVIPGMTFWIGLIVWIIFTIIQTTQQKNKSTD